MGNRIIGMNTFLDMGPLIRSIGLDLAQTQKDIDRMLGGPPEDLSPGPLAHALDHVRKCVGEFHSIGGVVRSCDPVQVEFIAEVDAAIGYLEWRCGARSGPRFVRTDGLCVAEGPA